MRIPQDLRRTVLFVGHQDDRPDRGGIHCMGTAFLLVYKTCVHLVTAKHVAQGLGEGPFLIRVNMKDGTSQNRRTDEEVRWQVHEEDLDVDLAISLFSVSWAGCDIKAVPEDMLASDLEMQKNGVGPGDQTYAVGLFRLLHGQKRNLPVVHTGNIALFPGDERVPVDDWDMPDSGRRRWVEAYLVEAQTLQGLSGAPVFVRPTVISPEFENKQIGKHYARLGRLDLLLLGMWQGSWDAKTDATLAEDKRRELRVPVGMGVVVPVSKILEVLEMPKLKEERDAAIEHRERGNIAALDDRGSLGKA